MKDLIVLILAAGKSTRFWPLSDKNLFRYFGQRLIDFQIGELRKAGFSNIGVIGNSQNFNSFKNIPGIFVVCQKGEGQGAAILSARQYLKGKSVLVVNADDVLETSIFEEVRRKVNNSDIEGLFCGYKLDRYLPLGYYVIDKENFVTRIVEKPKEGKQPSNIARIVIDYYRDSDKLIKNLEKIATKNDCFYELGIELMLKEIKFRMIHYQGYWGIIKFPWQVLSVMNYFLKGIKRQKFGKNVKIDKRAILSGQIWLDDNVRIMENVKIVGPCYIGKNTIIGNNSMIRNSMIGADCIIGFSSDIARSYLGDNTWTHSNYIGDSVVSNNVSFGAGSMTANLRLDEGEIKSLILNKIINSYRDKLGAIIGEGVRIGVNTSLMPGIKIGKNSFVGAGVVLNQDVTENTFCYMNAKLIFVKNKMKVESKRREEFKKKING